MRLHRLVITGVGPFRDRQEIDFDELTESGLFLIDGPTGSGKTTIIDAIVYALFGVVSGGKDSDPDRMRSSYCGADDPTGVTCEFSVNGRRHRITRVPAGARDPQEPTRAARAKPARQTLTELDADGAEMLVLVRQGEVSAHVEALLGMTPEQFRQLVVLPQGQFAELLRMTPTARLDALASLLGDEFFTSVQEDLRLQGIKAEDARRAARADVLKAAQQLAGRLRTHLDEQDPLPAVDFTDPAAADEARTLAVTTLIDDLAEQAVAAVTARDAQQVVTSTRRDTSTSAEAIAAALALIGGARLAVAVAEAALDPADAGIDHSAVTERIGGLRTLEGSLGDPAEWESQAPDRHAQRAALVEIEAQGLDAAGRLAHERSAIPARRTGLGVELAAAQHAAATLEAAEAQASRLAGLVATAAELQGLEPQVAGLARQLQDAESSHEAAEAVAHRAVSAWEALVELQRDERAAALAATLVPGGECPVCGSTEHPRPAHPSGEAQLVSDESIEEAKLAVDRSREAARKAAAGIAPARTAWQTASTLAATLAGALAGRTHEDVSADYAIAAADLTDAQQAASAVSDLQAELTGLAEREGALDKGIAEHEAAAAKARTTLDVRAVAEHEREQQIRRLIGEAPSATSLLAGTRARIDALTTLQEAHATLAEAVAAVPADRRHLSQEAATEAAAEAAAELAAAEAELATMTERAAGLTGVVDDARPMASEFTEALATRRRVDESTHAAVTLAALVTARNPRSLPLRSYALQRRFETVLEAASQHLERMSAGKFSFELSDHSDRGYSGLGIAVHDAWTGHRQEPKSLSGGETFYASLSLALGLADVVRGEAGGSALETLFIDEGFGSLDQDTLYQVLDQLDRLRSGRRAVGVVSHVTEMKESIPDRIEVHRQADSTSTVTRPSAAST